MVVSVGRIVTGPIDRLARFGSRSPGRYPIALLSVAVTVTVLEWPATDFDHGTHLLVLLTVVMGIALLLGPGPATAGIATGGSVAGIASILTVEGALASPHSYVQLLTYLVAGSAFIVLVSVIRARQRTASPPAPAPAANPNVHGLVEPLTARELEVLRLAATGITVDEIAGRLFLSSNTVKTHLTHVYAKLGARGRADAVRAAIHCGCLSREDICPHVNESPHRESPIPVSPEHRNR
jgi:DNA-binding CsgD family transcriptional regulator